MFDEPCMTVNKKEQMWLSNKIIFISDILFQSCYLQFQSNMHPLIYSTFQEWTFMLHDSSKYDVASSGSAGPYPFIYDLTNISWILPNNFFQQCYRPIVF